MMMTMHPFPSTPLATLLAPPTDNNAPAPTCITWPAWRYQHARQWIDTIITEAIDASWRQQVAFMPPALHPAMEQLWQATRHACLLGGKRVRPILSLLVADALGIKDATLLKGICLSSEFTHAQSLVFDDLPCMDDDDLRRGKPTTHVAYDEATAVLVGDALASFAYQCLSHYSPKATPEEMNALLQLIELLGGVASFQGLVNGQYADMVSAKSPASLEHLRYIHANKTGALLRYAIVAPAILHGADAAIHQGLTTWANIMGQLFQAKDDVLDATATAEALGKTIGKDAEQQKLTYLQVLGLEGTLEEINRLEDEGSASLYNLAGIGVNTQYLLEFQTFLVHRGA
jgi:geranylgeranyl pyrophosphate synthase